MKRRLARFLLSTVAATVACLALEWAVRLLFPQFDPAGHVHVMPGTPDRPPLGEPNTTARQVKNTGEFDVAVRFNAYGLRDSRDLRASTPDDIAVIGDSFSFGWGVEENERFSDRLEPLLGVRVFNVAMPSATLVSYGNLLKHAEGLGLRTRRIVVGVCMENDILAASRSGPVPPPRFGALPGLASAKARLKRRSALFFMTSYLIHTSPPMRNLFVGLGLMAPDATAVPISQLTPTDVDAAAGDIIRLGMEHDLTVLIVPSRGLWNSNTCYLEERIHDCFVTGLARAGIRVADPRPAMAASGSPLQYHFPRDGHWNPAGHALAAEVLAEELQRAGGGT